MNFHRLDGIEGNFDGKTAGHGIDGLGGIHQQHPLGFQRAFDVDLSVGRADDARDQRQGGLKFLFGQGKGPQLLGAHRGGG